MGIKNKPINDKFDPSLICPTCKYDSNLKGSEYCVICSSKLIEQDRKPLFYPPSPKSLKRGSKVSGRELILRNKSQDCFNFIRRTQNPSSYKEISKPINLAGLFVVGFALMLWGNYLFVSNLNKRANEKANTIDKSTDQKAVDQAPGIEGLFSYGGASIFAPLIANGMNAGIEAQNPRFELRYTKPLNQDYSSSHGIGMLIDGELSFAFNDRVLTDAEFKKAKLREINLRQVPLAIDGVVVFGNNNLKVSQLNLEQVRKIFTGEVENWNEIDSSIKDLPITPIIVSNERSEVLGIEGNKTASSSKYTANYTQALREVIATPGSISFASASLVQNQQLIKMFELADGKGSNYIKPVVNGKLNLKGFRSGTYPLTRRIFLVYREDGTLDRKAGIAYSNYINSPEGQKTVEKSGFVPIYKIDNN